MPTATERLPVQLPTTREAFLALRSKRQQPKALERVDAVVQQLWDNPEYRKFHATRDHAHAVTGHVIGDQMKAAEMVIKVLAQYDDPLQHEKPGAIMKLQERALARSGLSLTRRRRMNGNGHDVAQG